MYDMYLFLSYITEKAQAKRDLMDMEIDSILFAFFKTDVIAIHKMSER